MGQTASAVKSTKASASKPSKSDTPGTQGVSRRPPRYGISLLDAMGEAFGGAAASLRPTGIQFRDGGGQAAAGRTAAIHQAALGGLQGPGQPLPFADLIQRSFGDHGIRHVRAHIDGPAAQANSAMGSRAYTRGDHVAFRDPPSLYTAAHEAAHVVQQRAGVSLPGGVGRPGDAYERQADAVAGLVARGQSAAPLLDGLPPAPSVSRADSVQCLGETDVIGQHGFMGWTSDDYREMGSTIVGGLAALFEHVTEVIFDFGKTVFTLTKTLFNAVGEGAKAFFQALYDGKSLGTAFTEAAGAFGMSLFEGAIGGIRKLMTMLETAVKELNGREGTEIAVEIEVDIPILPPLLSLKISLEASLGEREDPDVVLLKGKIGVAVAAGLDASKSIELSASGGRFIFGEIRAKSTSRMPFVVLNCGVWFIRDIVGLFSSKAASIVESCLHTAIGWVFPAYNSFEMQVGEGAKVGLGQKVQGDGTMPVVGSLSIGGNVAGELSYVKEEEDKDPSLGADLKVEGEIAAKKIAGNLFFAKVKIQRSLLKEKDGQIEAEVGLPESLFKTIAGVLQTVREFANEAHSRFSAFVDEVRRSLEAAKEAKVPGADLVLSLVNSLAGVADVVKTVINTCADKVDNLDVARKDSGILALMDLAIPTQRGVLVKVKHDLVKGTTEVDVYVMKQLETPAGAPTVDAMFRVARKVEDGKPKKDTPSLGAVFGALVSAGLARAVQMAQTAQDAAAQQARPTGGWRAVTMPPSSPPEREWRAVTMPSR